MHAEMMRQIKKKEDAEAALVAAEEAKLEVRAAASWASDVVRERGLRAKRDAAYHSLSKWPAH